MIPSIKYTFLLVVFSVANCLTIKKCCKSDEALKIDTYECSSELKEYVLPLTIRNSSNIEFGCDSGYCTDKTVDGKRLLQVSCDKKTVKPTKLPTIFKCCPWNMFYNDTTKSCIVTNDLSSTEGSIFDSSSMNNLVFGVPKCSDNDALVDYVYDDNFTINDGVLSVGNTRKFENGTYCVDRSQVQGKIYIRTCKYKRDVCNDMTCISKCCPSGQKYFKKSSLTKSECKEDFTLPFTPGFINSNEENITAPGKMGLLSSINCKRYMQNKFTIYENGSLNFDSHMFNGIDQTFCVDYMDGPNIKGYIAIVCFPQDQPSDPHNFYYLAGLLVSIIFLGITLTIYFFLPELQNLHGRTLMSHSTSLMASYIFLAMVKKPLTKYELPTCLILAYGIMYTFLVAFAWLNVMCFDIWYTFGVVKARGMKKNKDLKKFLLYSLYAYGVPLIIVIITLYIDRYSDVPKKFVPNFGGFSCWFDLRSASSHWPYTIYFGIPVGLILLFNMILFILTVKHCLRVRNDIQRMQHADSGKKGKFFTDKATLIMNFKLFIVMGISWIFEVMAMYVREPYWIWYILDTINVLQGLWIFCIFVLKNNVWKALRKKLGYQVVREGSQTQSTTFSTKNSVASTSFRMNGDIRPEERDLLQIAVRNSANSVDERQ